MNHLYLFLCGAIMTFSTYSMEKAAMKLASAQGDSRPQEQPPASTLAAQAELPGTAQQEVSLELKPAFLIIDDMQVELTPATSISKLPEALMKYLTYFAYHAALQDLDLNDPRTADQLQRELRIVFTPDICDQEHHKFAMIILMYMKDKFENSRPLRILMQKRQAERIGALEAQAAAEIKRHQRALAQLQALALREKQYESLTMSPEELARRVETSHNYENVRTFVDTLVQHKLLETPADQ